MTAGVYVIAHAKTGACYVGSSVDIERRWKRHCAELSNGNHHSFKLNRLRSEKLHFSIVDVVDKDQLTRAEQGWMDMLDSVSNGLNVCPNANNPGSLPKTDLHKSRIGAAHLGMKRSAEARARISSAKLGKRLGPMAPEHAAKISASKIGRPMSDEAKKKLSVAKRGVKTGPCSELRRAAISAAKRQRDAKNAAIKGLSK